MLTGWKYYRKITISGSSGAGNNYQVLLKVGESSGSSGYDFQLGGNSSSFPSAKNDGGDLRFTADDGQTLLDFWVEKVEGTSPNRVATIWVKVSADLGSDQSIYIYYGNSSATNASTGSDTFNFFDDFPGTSLDSQWTPTTQNGGTITVSDNQVDLMQAAQASSMAHIIATATVFNANYAVRYNATYTDLLANSYRWAGKTENSTDPNDYMLFDAVSSTAFWAINAKAGTTVHTDVTSSLGIPETYQITHLASEIKYWIDDVLKATHTTDIPTVDLYPALNASGSSTAPSQAKHLYCDWILIRKYVSPEPAFSSVGTEKTSINMALFFGNNF